MKHLNNDGKGKFQYGLGEVVKQMCTGVMTSSYDDRHVNTRTKVNTPGLKVPIKKGTALFFQVQDVEEAISAKKPKPFYWQGWHALCVPQKKQLLIAEKRKEFPLKVRTAWKQFAEKKAAKKAGLNAEMEKKIKANAHVREEKDVLSDNGKVEQALAKGAVITNSQDL